MKNTMKKLAALLAVLLLVSLTACGGKKAPEEAGNYVLYEFSDGTDSLTYEDLVELELAEGSTLVLNEDGKGTLTLAGEDPDDFTWADGKMNADGEIIDYTYKDNYLTIDLGDDTTMTFVRESELNKNAK